MNTYISLLILTLTIHLTPLHAATTAVPLLRLQRDLQQISAPKNDLNSFKWWFETYKDVSPTEEPKTRYIAADQAAAVITKAAGILRNIANLRSEEFEYPYLTAKAFKQPKKVLCWGNLSGDIRGIVHDLKNITQLDANLKLQDDTCCVFCGN